MGWKEFLADAEERKKLARSLLDVTNRGIVAGTLGAPVDLATSALKAGGWQDAPEKPVGGSEWLGDRMQSAGMVSGERNQLAEGLAGMVDPATMLAGGAKAALAAGKALPLVFGGLDVKHLKSSSHLFDFNTEELSKLPFKSRELLREIPIDTFLTVAEKGSDATKTEGIKKLLDSKTKFSDLPYLLMDESGKIYAHEGRHRARALKELGYDTMPVKVISRNIRWSEQSPERFDYIENWPEKMTSEDSKINIPFPFDRKGNVIR